MSKESERVLSFSNVESWHMDGVEFAVSDKVSTIDVNENSDPQGEGSDLGIISEIRIYSDESVKIIAKQGDLQQEILIDGFVKLENKKNHLVLYQKRS